MVIGASKVVGIARLKYELWKKGGMRAGTPPLQTANVVYPAFAHTFTGLPLGDYEVRRHRHGLQCHRPRARL